MNTINKLETEIKNLHDILKTVIQDIEEIKKEIKKGNNNSEPLFKKVGSPTTFTRRIP